MKKLKNYFSLLLIIASIIVLSSCNKENSVTPVKSRSELIVGSWLMDSSIVLGVQNKGLLQGKYVLSFNSSGSFGMTDEKKIEFRTGTWKFQNNESDLELEMKDISKFSLQSISILTDTKMKLQYTDNGLLSTDYYTKIKLKNF